jgi:hypothetical protein
MTITAVPTTYNGVSYRSRLEADWAAMLTELEVYFEYEPDPVRFPSGAVYDPDFYLPTLRTYCEAKGPQDQRLWKARELAALLALDEYPRMYQVVVLRPAGPRGEAAWESARPSDPTPRLANCDGCRLWGFTDINEVGESYCRRCWSTDVQIETYYSGLVPDKPRDCYLPMAHAPRRF